MKTIRKPLPGEFPEYASMYINLIPDDGKVLTHLGNSFLEINKLVSSLSDEKLLYRYQKDKWTIKEVLVHIIDDERIYAYRALRFARNDETILPGFDQDDFAKYSDANNRPIANIMEEYEAVRPRNHNPV